MELLTATFVLIMAACFFGELSYVKPPASKVLTGMFTLKLSGNTATRNAIALLSALVIPHNPSLYSASTLFKKFRNRSKVFM